MSGSFATIKMGADQRLQPGDGLVVYKDRERVGRIVLAKVGARESLAQVVEQSTPIESGFGVSEFTVATQVVAFKSPAVALGEIIAVAVVLGAFAALWALKKRSVFELVGNPLRRAVASANGPIRLTLLGILSLPVSWFVASFLASLIPYVAHLANSLFGGDLDASVPSIRAALQSAQPVLMGACIVVYLAVLATTKESPQVVLWRKIRFRGGPLKWVPDGVPRDVVTWLLHLLIAYAFAYSLFQFLGADVRDALAAGWPGSGLAVQGNIESPAELLRTAFTALGYMATHAPHFGSVELVFITIRDLLFTVTIMGCLVGYGHSVLGFLWGKQIRNLDFTLPGWITNAICYGPLLGLVVAGMTPPIVGKDPIFASGPLYYFGLCAELALNVVYTLTIWNLGTMFGVMTDKGVRTTGFYSVVRHPSYTTEALMFVVLFLKGLTGGGQWLAAAMFLVIYWLRSEREDDFMGSSNPDYSPYRKATPYKFIPGIY
jgi:protein-S-isoprenylcysteine O-methyltransferase Ste14